ncbi:MAG: glycosyltransferase family 2 protein [Lachnospiraceae bacterium]|nr:glycosyltransferase family 2 protein [Lachnospiraceae bacterium]
MPKISIIVPIYNAKKAYLKHCLKSLVSQTLYDMTEIILVDDGSTNGCDSVAKKCAEKYENVTLISGPNEGTSAARNKGLKAARGEYVMFVDADDYLERDCCEKVLRTMEQSPVDLLFFGYATDYTNREMHRVLYKSDKSIWQRESLEMAVLRGDKRLGPVDVGAPWGKLIKRSIIEDNSLHYPVGLPKGQDTVFSLHLIEHCSSFSYLSYLGYHYRISGTSVSHRFNPDIVSIMEKTLSAYRGFTLRYNKGEKFREAVDLKYAKVLMGEYLELLYLHPKNSDPMALRKKDYLRLIGREPYKAALSSLRKKRLWKELGFPGMLLIKGAVGPLFMYKKLEMAARQCIVRKYE